jgi:hypothetical protein
MPKFGLGREARHGSAPDMLDRPCEPRRETAAKDRRLFFESRGTFRGSYGTMTIGASDEVVGMDQPTSCQPLPL